MKILILDFLRRWRWLFLLALLLSVASSVFGTPFVIAPAAVVALLIDAQRGVFRAVRPLPITRVEQARAWWFVGVPLLPLLSVPALVLGVLLFHQFNPHADSAAFNPFATRVVEPPPPMEVRAQPVPGVSAPGPEHRFIAPPQAPGIKAPAPWFAATVQAWVALGYAGFCFFLMQWAPMRPAENIAENVQQGTFGLLWGISMPGVAFLLPMLPRTPDVIAGWHWAIFVASPIFVALSYFSAGELVRRRLLVTAVKARPPAGEEARVTSGGLGGIPLYIVTFAGRIVVFVALIAVVQLVVFRWMIGATGPMHNPALGMQVAVMGMIIGTVLAEGIGLRALRALPLSTPRLALLLALIPWAGAFTSAVFSAVVCRAGDPGFSVGMNLAAQSLALCGWVTLAFAIMLHIASSGRLFVLMLLVMIPGFAIPFAAGKFPVLFAVIGAVAGLIGFALLVRGLRKSSAFYQPRGFFGMTPGQPSAVR